MKVILQQQFRNLVNHELQRLHWSRSLLAEKMGVTTAYVSNYLNGDRDPGDDVKEKFFRALGVQPRLTIEPLGSTESVPATVPSRGDMLTVQQVAEQFGVSDARIRQICIELGVGTKDGKVRLLSANDIERIRGREAKASGRPRKSITNA